MSNAWAEVSRFVLPLAAVVALFAVSCSPFAWAQSLDPLKPGMARRIEAIGFSDIQETQAYWEGAVADPNDPRLIMSPVRIDADRMKFVAAAVATHTAQGLQLFFSSKGSDAFSEQQSVRTFEVQRGESPCLYLFDMSDVPAWRGEIDALRLDLDGAERGDRVRVYAVEAFAERIEAPGDVVLIDIKGEAPAARVWERMAAWHRTLVSIEETRGHAYVASYLNDRAGYTEAYALAKLVAGIDAPDGFHGPQSGDVQSVEDFPGGVKAAYAVDGVHVSTEIVPLAIGRGAETWEGAALYTIATDPPSPVVVRCGPGALINKMSPDWPRNPQTGGEGSSVQLMDGIATLTAANVPLHAAAVSSGSMSVEPGDGGGQRLRVDLPGGSGEILVAFSEQAPRALELARLDAAQARAEVLAYYEKLMDSRVNTSDSDLDNAFRAALYNLEYNWVEPYGWNECINHWLALWHMQHTGAASWIGQADRARACNVTTAQYLYPDGAAPQFYPNGIVHRDFGGSNQFFAWQVRHHWLFTADRAAAAVLGPALDRVIGQTFSQYDADHNLLLAWGQQIGNQEDYVSTPYDGTTPTIEGINMMRTRILLAEALGDEAAAEPYAHRINVAATRLERELWLPDLGRFAFFKDPRGVVRLDGQYHTFIYPLIWGLSDPFESWTSMRHLRDRLTGAGGEVYCSNNFPNHVGGTWGMQAGAAQQPWAAWGLSSMGLRNETYRPLHAVAAWVMNDDHRGAWPEIAEEPCPAYFSPPAGLYVQAVVEALFGLTVDRPAETLTVAPSFPDGWSEASLHVPGFSVSYRPDGGKLFYTVATDARLARALRWKLPPGRFARVHVDGRPADYMVLPGVNCVELRIDSPASTETQYEIDLEPLEYSVEHPEALAEGDSFIVRVDGCAIERVYDRCGVLGSMKISPGLLEASVRSGQLAPYAGYGRLGQMNFARRSFFIGCSTGEGLHFIVPIDLTLLPRYEAAGVGEVQAGPQGVRLIVRNNCKGELSGTARLRVARHAIPFELELAARSEKEVALPFDASYCALLSPGDNAAQLVLPNGTSLELTLEASQLFQSEEPLERYARQRIVQVPLPEALLQSDETWRDLRPWYAYGHMPWNAAKPPLLGLGDQEELEVEGLPGVRFALPGRKIAAVSWRTAPAVRVPLKSGRYKKLYLLVVPFLDNHDTFAPVARVIASGPGGIAASRTLHFPGDLDWWIPQAIVGAFSTVQGPRPDRFGLLPMLGKNGDWPEAVPPAFPQPAFWASCRAVETSTTNLNVIELDLGRPTTLDAVALETVGADPALGLVAVCAETGDGGDLLDGTPWEPAAAFREPAVLFDLTSAEGIDAWEFQGGAFSVSAVPSLFSEPSLNSLGKAGETATGKAISPAFTVGPQDARLTFTHHGGRSEAGEGPGFLGLRLIDAQTGQALATYEEKAGTPQEQWGSFDVESFQGKQLRLEIADENTKPSFAWLGVRRVYRAPAGVQ